MLLHLKELLWYGYECWGFRLADNTFLYPDFPIAFANPPRIEIHDTKGWLREDAHIKTKIAAEMYPVFKWAYVKKIKGDWVTRYVR